MGTVLVVLLGVALFFIVMGALLFASAFLIPDRSDERAREKGGLARSLNGQTSPDYGERRHKSI